MLKELRTFCESREEGEERREGRGVRNTCRRKARVGRNEEAKEESEKKRHTS